MTERDDKPDYQITPEHLNDSQAHLEGVAQPYTLTRRAFLDVIWNRLEVVHFYPTTAHDGRIFALPNCLDRFGRVKVALAINSDNTLERQGEILVHEAIHVDRNSWEKVAGISTFSQEFYQIVSDEESIVNQARDPFYVVNKRLVAKALNHVWLHREPFE